MRKMKLFPKTFIYVFFLMASIALISHGMFFFFMPLVYTGQKEEALRAAETRLREELKGISYDSRQEIETVIRKYALQNGMGIFVNFAGHTYNFIADTSLSEEKGTAVQGEYGSGWTVQVEEEAARKQYGEDFYRKTDSQLCSGTYFRTADGHPCLLVILQTLQPVNEAKDIVIIFFPFTLALSLVLSVIFALLYSKKITKPLSEISRTTERMRELDRTAVCKAETQDEIGVLSENINNLYRSLLDTIEDIQRESARVSEAEAAKTDFLRAASHELKTPVTALCGMLDNMIMGIGRYGDWENYLPVCREMAGRFGRMIQEILDASKTDFCVEEEPEAVSLHGFVEKLLPPWTLTAKAKGVVTEIDLTQDFYGEFPASAMEKALNNIISNAIKYTNSGDMVRIYLADKTIVVENECVPIDPDDLAHIFEPFYRPDFSRSRNSAGENPNGGNGLGLYIAAKILKSLKNEFVFEPFFYPDDNGKGGMRFTIFF